MSLTGWSETPEQAQERWNRNIKKTETAIAEMKELTAAEIERLSQPFPGNRTQAEKEADLLLAKRALQIALTSMPQPNQLATQAIGVAIAVFTASILVQFALAWIFGG